MREREMRQRVERFIQTRLRNMLMPATLGLGLALGAGCDDDEALNAADAGGQVEQKDAGTADQQMAPDAELADASSTKEDLPVTKYMAQIPDASADLPDPVLDYMAPIPKTDASLITKYMAQIPDASTEIPLAAPEYIAPIPRDAGISITPVYSASLPDSGVAMRYMAQMPDSGSGVFVAVYSAPLSR
jgi:hypothetical protein